MLLLADVFVTISTVICTTDLKLSTPPRNVNADLALLESAFVEMEELKLEKIVI